MTKYQVRHQEADGVEILHLEGPDGVPGLSMVPAQGAMAYSWRVANRDGSPVEMIWPGNLAEALKLRAARILLGFPYLFPFANRVFVNGEVGAYLWEGERREMTIHGFSNACPWTVAGESAGADHAEVTLVLEENDYSLRMYPWRFRVCLTWRLEAARLTIDQKVENRDDRPMPLSPGWHPYFMTPFGGKGAKSECILEVPGRTGLGINLDTAGMTGESFPFYQQRMTLGEHGLTGKYITDLTEPRVALCDPAAGLGVEMDLRGPDGGLAWPYILTWTADDQIPFFCVEPYEGVTDAVHSGKGLRLLGAGEGYSTRLVAERIWTA